MAERYVVHPSGEEILMLDGETAKQALARYDSAVDGVMEIEAVVLVDAAANEPAPAAPTTESPVFEHAKQWLAGAFGRLKTAFTSHRLLFSTLIGLALVAILVVAGTNLVRVAEEGAQQAEQQALADAAAADEAETRAMEAAELDAAKDRARELLPEGRDFQEHSASYATEAQKKRLANAIDDLKKALTSESKLVVGLGIKGVEKLIKEIGQADTPAQQAARQAEKDVAAAAKAAADAAAAQIAVEEGYVQSVIASGRTVDAGNRAATLSAARDFCKRLSDSADQSLLPLVVLVRNATNSLPVAPATASFCPQYSAIAGVAAASISDGSFTVGTSIAEGTYVTLATGVKDCYWERSDGGGNIIDNDFITFAPNGVAVTVYAGEGFTVTGCGLWARQ